MGQEGRIGDLGEGKKVQKKYKKKEQRCYWGLIFIILSQQVVYTDKAQVRVVNTKIKRKCSCQNRLGTKTKEIKFVKEKK
jgi:hypothetical protein